jgi:hypothetical protein
MTCNPSWRRQCEQPHTCMRCGKTILCGTYIFACPWLNGHVDQMCDDCWNGLSLEEKTELDKMESDEQN